MRILCSLQEVLCAHAQEVVTIKILQQGGLRGLQVFDIHMFSRLSVFALGWYWHTHMLFTAPAMYLSKFRLWYIILYPV